jgi:D-alanine-D-alanine ligase
VPDSRIRVAVLFGGRSGEHDVSCRSAASILANLDPRRYEITPVRIGRDGVWAVGSDDPPGASPAGSVVAAMERLRDQDVVFPALHGRYGEDGTVQLLLGEFGIPFVGNGVAASALSMDKEFTKKIAAGVGLAVSDAVVLRGGQDDVSAADRARLGLPVFVKPAREGSSIGVSRVDDWSELPAALDRARASDAKVLVEAAVIGREVDIGVLERPGGELAVSPALEIRTSDAHGFFDYDAKYDDASTVFDIPAALDPATTDGLGQDALRLFRALGGRGLLRVDFFVRPDGRRVLNEVNTFPGFTSASQYPRMWQAAGLGYPDLLDVLIDTALASAPAATGGHITRTASAIP